MSDLRKEEAFAKAAVTAVPGSALGTFPGLMYGIATLRSIIARRKPEDEGRQRSDEAIYYGID